MSQTTSADRPSNAPSQDPAPQKAESKCLLLRRVSLLKPLRPGHSHGSVTSLTASQPTAVDDNPRSPKRRRVSSNESQRNLGDVAKAQIPKAPQPEPVEPTVIAEGQRQNVATNSPQRPTPPRMAPLDHLPALDKQASELLSFLSRLTPTESLELSNSPNAPSTKMYVALRASFDRTRRLVSPGWPFLSQYDLGLRNSVQIEIIRKANQAIFISSIFTGEVGLRDMDRSFLAVFVPEHGHLLKPQASMYLELKTQGFITAWRTGAAPPHIVMADLFGPDLDKTLLARRPGTTGLSPIEQEFLGMLDSRRSTLETYIKNKTVDQLHLRYKWEDFSRQVSTYLVRHIENTYNPGGGVADGHSDHPSNGAYHIQMKGQFEGHGQQPPVLSTGQLSTVPPEKEDYVALAARAAETALRSTLGLSQSEMIPDLPAQKPSSLRRDISTPGPASAEAKSTGGSAKTALPKDEKSTPEGISHASRPGSTSVLDETAGVTSTRASLETDKDEPEGGMLVKIEGDTDAKPVDRESNQEAPVVNTNGQSPPLNETKKPFQPSKEDVDALIARATAARSTEVSQ